MEILRFLTGRNIIKILVLASLFIFPADLYPQDAEKKIKAFRESYAFESTGELRKAIEALRGVYDEKSYEINLRLGWLSYQSGSFTESVSYYNRAVEIMPYAIEPRFGIAYPLSAMGNWDQVMAHYNKILSIDPNNSYANYRIGVIYYNREDYTSAHRHLEKVVNLYPFDLDALVMFGWCNYRMNRPREARMLFERALMHTPNNASALEGLSLVN